MPKSSTARLVALTSAAIALGLVIAVAVRLWPSADIRAKKSLENDVTGAALIGGPFTLTDQHGTRISDNSFRGRLMLVYFGYSYCPDVCPTDLAAMSTAIDLLGLSGNAVQPVFITIDPERDTVQRLAEYASLFHPRLVALTGTPDEIRQVAAEYRVYFEKSGSGPNYQVNHSDIIYLMDRNGGFITHFGQGTTPEQIAAAIRQHLDQGSAQGS
jgi:cytochrome oxidase Cu insertion factor (SCO1/SenC/PrrC family)